MNFFNQKGLSSIAIIAVLAILSSAIFFKVASQGQTFQGLTLKDTPLGSPMPTATPSPSPKPATPAPTQTPTPPPVINNAPPGSGFSRQNVSVDGQNYPVSMGKGFCKPIAIAAT